MRQQNLLHEKNKAAKQQRGRFLFALPPLKSGLHDTTNHPRAVLFLPFV